MATMSAEAIVQLVVGSVLGVLGWSLRQNVKAFGTKLDDVSRDQRTIAISVATHDTRIAVLDTRVTAVEGRVTGIETRERKPAA